TFLGLNASFTFKNTGNATQDSSDNRSALQTALDGAFGAGQLAVTQVDTTNAFSFLISSIGKLANANFAAQFTMTASVNGGGATTVPVVRGGSGNTTAKVQFNGGASGFTFNGQGLSVPAPTDEQQTL